MMMPGLMWGSGQNIKSDGIVMIDGKSILAVIPARGGSKRLPNKNILDLAEKPLIAWSIEAGLNSKYIDTVVVSSDSDEILDISKNIGTDII